jgi:hypothetical protein
VFREEVVILLTTVRIVARRAGQPFVAGVGNAEGSAAVAISTAVHVDRGEPRMGGPLADHHVAELTVIIAFDEVTPGILQHVSMTRQAVYIRRSIAGANEHGYGCYKTPANNLNLDG